MEHSNLNLKLLVKIVYHIISIAIKQIWRCGNFKRKVTLSRSQGNAVPRESSITSLKSNDLKILNDSTYTELNSGIGSRKITWNYFENLLLVESALPKRLS